MSASSKLFPENPEIEQEASDWILRQDRGLTAEEQDEYSQWLGSDSRHREAIAVYKWGWDEFDRLAGLQTSRQAQVDPDLLAPGNRFVRKAPLIKAVFGAFSVAAMLAIAAIVYWSNQEMHDTQFATKPAIELIARIEQRSLEDGSMVELNRGAVIETEYSSEARRVKLVSGEANFTVVKDPSRPFIVNVGGVDVQAVGTQFNVKLSSDSVDVIVSEGVVKLASVSQAPNVVDDSLLRIGDHATVKLGENPRLRVTTLSPLEMELELGWQPQLLDFEDVSIVEIVAEFNKRNQVQLSLVDPELKELRLSNYFWSDNVEGFVRLMERSFGMKAEWRGSTEIALKKVGS